METNEVNLKLRKMIHLICITLSLVRHVNKLSKQASTFSKVIKFQAKLLPITDRDR